MNLRLRPAAAVFFATLSLLVPHPALGDPTFINLGSLTPSTLIPGGVPSVLAGQALVIGAYAGVANPNNPNNYDTIPCRWTIGGGLQALDPLSSYAQATGISADGAILVGHKDFTIFLWSTGGGITDLGFPDGRTYVTGGPRCSADGAVVAAIFGASNIQLRTYLWTQADGFTSIGTPVPPPLDEDVGVYGYGLSADGTTVVGSTNFGASDHAFRWTSGGGFEDLGDLAGGSGYSSAFAASGDGSIVVGVSDDPAYPDWGGPFIWQGGVMSGLAPLPGSVGGWTSAISTDGSRIVGTCVVGPSEEYRPTLWNSGVPIDLFAHLTTLGIDLTGWAFEDATGVSDDGDAVCGVGTFNGRYSGWIVVGLNSAPPPTPCPGDADINGEVNFADITSVLTNFGIPCP